MNATLGTNKLKIENFGESTTVPNNDFAKLMYYLDCVSTVIQYNDNTLTDYKNYNELNIEEIAAVYALATVLEP